MGKLGVEISSTARVLRGTKGDDRLIGTSTAHPQEIFGEEGDDWLELPWSWAGGPMGRTPMIR